MTAVPAMTSCRARRWPPSRMPANPRPKNRNLNGSVSVRTTVYRSKTVVTGLNCGGSVTRLRGPVVLVDHGRSARARVLPHIRQVHRVYLVGHLARAPQVLPYTSAVAVPAFSWPVSSSAPITRPRWRPDRRAASSSLATANRRTTLIAAPSASPDPGSSTGTNLTAIVPRTWERQALN